MFADIYKNKTALITGHAGLNWRSILTIDECLHMTAEWYKMFYEASSHEATYKFCTKQIAEYVERAKKPVFPQMICYHA